MENKLKFLIFLVLTIKVTNQKQETPPKSALVPYIVRFFFKESTFPSIPFIAVISLSDEFENISELSVLVENLSKISANSLKITDEHLATFEDRCHVIIIYDPNQLDRLVKIFNKIVNTTLSLKRVFIWTRSDISDNERTFIVDLGKISKINEIIFVQFIGKNTKGNVTGHSGWTIIMAISVEGKAFKQDLQKVLFPNEIKVDVEKVSVSLENLILLEKKPEVGNGLKYLASTLNVDQVTQEINNTLRRYAYEIESIPIQVISFIRPLSVERDQVKSQKPVYVGADIKYLEALAWQLNLSYILEIGEPSQFGTMYKNGTYTKTLQGILDNKIDIGMNRYLPLRGDMIRAIVVPIDRERLCFVLRKPQSKIRNWSVLSAFQLPVWIGIVGVHIFVLVFFYYWKTPHWSFITFLQTIVSAMHTQIPMTREGQRIMYLFWLWFNFLINNSFVTVFVAQLLPLNEAEQFRTLKDLVEANTTLLSEIGQFEFDHSIKRVKFIKFLGKPEIITGNTALLTSQLTRLKLFKMFPSEFYFVPECITTFSGPLISPSSTIFEKTITFNSRLHAAGFFEFWVRNHLLNVVTMRGNLGPSLDQDILDPLKLNEIIYLIEYWAFGVVFATCVFISEVFLINKKCK